MHIIYQFNLNLKSNQKYQFRRQWPKRGRGREAHALQILVKTISTWRGRFCPPKYYTPHQMFITNRPYVGQIILKCLYGVAKSPKKSTWISTQIFAQAYWGRNFSFVFWENWKNKIFFEINWRQGRFLWPWFSKKSQKEFRKSKFFQERPNLIAMSSFRPQWRPDRWWIFCHGQTRLFTLGVISYKIGILAPSTVSIHSFNIWCRQIRIKLLSDGPNFCGLLSIF